ncbi:MarR family winged helix-turn-helix transcriptional regulator [Sphingosinicella terrae]|uniref:MarR family winged helix-turn-helix transcriptional regulator n=1 Tax=Sphingosinicella terrae TaxID=2172047 RepID=UPI000E0DC55E|nr:MarR family transcriptional regulator [Sphingosinicella terrae]
MDAEQVSELEDHLGYWLRIVSNAVSHAFARKVESQGVTVAEWVFLRSLYDRSPASPTQLAEAMGMTKGAISKLADRLVDKGLVLRSASAGDRRGHSLTLAPEGRRKVPALAALADANDADFFGGLDAEERDRLRQLLHRIAGGRGLDAAPID